MNASLQPDTAGRLLADAVTAGTGPALGAKPARASYRGHIVGLDALRGTAILMVLLCHAYYTTVPWGTWTGAGSMFVHLTALGSLGVQLFFVLSGFLISGILLDKVADPNYYRSFYIRRALRILPAYLLMLVALKLFKGVTWNYILACVLFIANMARLVGASSFEYGVLWSLAVEEQFYLLWPWAIRRLSRSSLMRVILAACLLSPLLRMALAAVGWDTYFKSWDNVDYLLYGALVALALREGLLHSRNLRPIAHRLLLFAAIFLVPATWMGMHDESVAWAHVVFSGVGRTPYMAIFVGALLLVIARHSERGKSPQPRPGPLTRTMYFFGDISYGLYLVHTLIFFLYDKWSVGTRLGGFLASASLLNVRAVIAIGISILLATLSRYFYEERFLSLKDRLAPAPAPSAAAAAPPLTYSTVPRQGAAS